MKSNLFKKAHEMAKALKAETGMDYRTCFSISLKKAWTMMKANETTTYIIPDWFAEKNALGTIIFDGEIAPSYAFESSQIKAESEKALKVRLAVCWKGGVDILKEIWIPKSVLSTTTKTIARKAADVRNYLEGDCFEQSKKFASLCASCYC